jgi:S-adenosylmethionine decarboxylase
MEVGVEWLIDAHGCAAATLGDQRQIEKVCNRIIAELGLRVLGQPLWHTFADPGGVTGLYMLTESHLSCHTFPEYGVATFNLFCCRPRPSWHWEERLTEMLGAGRVEIRVLTRGRAGAEGSRPAASLAADAVAGTQEEKPA